MSCGCCSPFCHECGYPINRKTPPPKATVVLTQEQFKSIMRFAKTTEQMTTDSHTHGRAKIMSRYLRMIWRKQS